MNSKILVCFISLINFSSFALAADFTMINGHRNTITVQGCKTAEVGDVMITPSITGEHLLSSRCLPVFCVFTNETPYGFINTGTKWTINLSARDASMDSTSPIFKGSYFSKNIPAV